MFKPNATFLHCSLYRQLPLSNASACWSIGRYRRSKHRKLLTSFSMTHQLLHVNFWLLRPMSHLRFYSAIYFVAQVYHAIKSQRATVQLHMTGYDILASSLVLLGCLAKWERTLKRGFQKRFDMKQFHHFGTVFVKEDRETGKLVQKPCLFKRQSRSVQLDSRRVCDFVAR